MTNLKYVLAVRTAATQAEEAVGQQHVDRYRSCRCAASERSISWMGSVSSCRDKVAQLQTLQMGHDAVSCKSQVNGSFQLTKG